MASDEKDETDGRGAIQAPVFDSENVASKPLKEDLNGHTGLLAKTQMILTWMPNSMRYDPDNPPKFTLGLNLLFAIVSLQLQRASTR
jgi:hypothetical protein